MERYALFNKVCGRYFVVDASNSFKDLYDLAIRWRDVLDELGKPHLLSIYDYDECRAYRIDFEFTDFDI